MRRERRARATVVLELSIIFILQRVVERNTKRYHRWEGYCFVKKSEAAGEVGVRVAPRPHADLQLLSIVDDDLRCLEVRNCWRGCLVRYGPRHGVKCADVGILGLFPLTCCFVVVAAAATSDEAAGAAAVSACACSPCL